MRYKPVRRHSTPAAPCGKNHSVAHSFSLSQTKPSRWLETNPTAETFMRTHICVLALATFALPGCTVVEERPATVTTTTEVRRETVTTEPATGRVTREVIVTTAPPTVRVETQTVSPGPRYVWTRGYWRWTGANYVWVPGSWVMRPRSAAVWVEGAWLRRPGGWVWVAGHWQ